MDKDENHERNNHHLGMGQDIYHKKKFTCTLSFSNGGQHCNTTNVEEVMEIIIDIDKVEPMSKVVQNYFQLNIHVLQFGYSFNPTVSTIEFKYTIKVFPINCFPPTEHHPPKMHPCSQTLNLSSLNTCCWNWLTRLWFTHLIIIFGALEQTQRVLPSYR